MKKKLRWLIGIGLLFFLLGFANGLAQSQEPRINWQERRREAAADADARVALESRLVKLEEGLSSYRQRLDWMEKVIWGAILGMVAMFGKEVLLAYFNRQARRNGHNSEGNDV